MVKGSFSFNSKRTMRIRGPPKIILKNSQLKGKKSVDSSTYTRQTDERQSVSQNEQQRAVRPIKDTEIEIKLVQT